MRLKARVSAGIVVTALTASVTTLSAGSANAVYWDQTCSHGAGNAMIVGDQTYCYYGLGDGYSNVYDVGSLHSGDFHAVFQSDHGPQDIPEGQIWPEPNIHTGNFTLCIC